ncbi:MAG: hypothetical protein RIA09_15890 [Hoeflea sp.]|jgi:hypothetical protein|uniref:hypothetical protein n=1 Tax=Hoeflea sp. TaxID=1940281 RepID=UPI0032EDFD21
MIHPTQYTPTLDIWSLPPEIRAKIQPGQWVKAGPNGARGRYLGQTKTGSDVVAWEHNARGKPGYLSTLRAYAKGAAALRKHVIKNKGN